MLESVFLLAKGEVLGGETPIKWCFAGLDILSAFLSESLILRTGWSISPSNLVC